MEMIILSQICYSFHYSVERYCICFTGHYSYVVRQDELPIEHDVRVLIALLAMTLQWIVTLGLRPHDLVGRVERLCSQSIWLSRLASGALFETYGVPFWPFQRIEICNVMPHWGIFPPHHFLAVWCSEPPFIRNLRHSESSEPLLHLAFRATIVSQFRRSESSSCFQFDVQSHHHHFVVWRSESLSRFRRSKPSSVFSLTFRAAFFSFSVQSHPHHIFSFGVQSHHYRVPRFRHLESSSLPSLTFRVAFPISAFRAIITSSFGIQSHRYHFLVSMFRAILITFSVSTIRAIITS